MKTSISFSLLCLLISILSSCSDSLLMEMNRTISDPVVSEPVARSFTNELIIELSWDEDPGADDYVLYRALDGSGDYISIYRGTDLQFTDRNIANEIRYLYRLVKMRGEEVFGPSGSVLGVGSMTVQDEFEPNDDKNKSTPFLYNLSANVHYYASDGIKHTLEDCDWYSIEIRPQMQATFKVEVSGVSANDPTGLMFYLQPDIPAEIRNQADLYIKNHTMEMKTFEFCIYPDGSQIITNNFGGGRIIHYELSFIGEQTIQ